MGIEKYFEREYNFLQAAGEDFAKKHPTLGSRLRMSERERKDPFVERLYEGFAFLAGRIQERLDDEFPEIAGGIATMGIAVNMIPHVVAATPGLKRMIDLPVPAALMGKSAYHRRV